MKKFLSSAHINFWILGDVDFYFNDRFITTQPGCITNHIGRILMKFLGLNIKKALRHSMRYIALTIVSLVPTWLTDLRLIC